MYIAQLFIQMRIVNFVNDLEHFASSYETCWETNGKRDYEDQD